MTSPASPSSWISFIASGLAEMKLSGPHSMMQSSHLRVSITPPKRGCFSMRVWAMPAFERSQAADNPAIPPPMITTWPLATGVWPLQFEFAHDFDARLHVFDRSLRKNPVPEVEDVARPRSGALQQLMHAHAQHGKRREQHRRIQIPLHGRPVADVHPRLVDVHAPINAHHVAARGVQLAEKARGAGTEVDYRNAGRANTLEQRPRIGS